MPFMQNLGRAMGGASGAFGGSSRGVPMRSSQVPLVQHGPNNPMGGINTGPSPMAPMMGPKPMAPPPPMTPPPMEQPNIVMPPQMPPNMGPMMNGGMGMGMGFRRPSSGTPSDPRFRY